MTVKTYPVESSHAALAAEVAELRRVQVDLLAALKFVPLSLLDTLTRRVLTAAIARAEGV